MFKVLFLSTLFITLLVNIIFLFATKDKPPDLGTSTYISIQQIQDETSSQRRLFLRSNDLYDYSSNEPTISSRTNTQISRTNDDDYDDEKLRGSDHSSTSQLNSKSQTYGLYSGEKITSLSSNGQQPTALPTNLVYEGTAFPNNRIRLDDYFLLQQQQLETSSRFSKRTDKLGLVDLVVGGMNTKSMPDMLSSDIAEDTTTITIPIESEINNAKHLAKGSEKSGKDEKENEYKYINMKRRFGKAHYNIINNNNNNFDRDVEKGRKDDRDEEQKVSSDRSLERAQEDEKKLNDGDNNNSNFNDDNLPSRNPLITFANNSKQHHDQTVHYQDSETVNDRDKHDRQVYGSRLLDIKVKSSKSHVLVSVDGIVIYESKSKPSSLGYQTGGSAVSSLRALHSATGRQQAQASGQISDDADSTEGRGIHVIVLNQYDGYVMSKRVFDTYSPGQDDELCFFLNMIRDGRILIFAIKDEGSFKMLPNSPARALLQKLGSQHISKLRWRDMWAFVARKITPSETNLRLGESSRQRLREAAKQMNLSETLTKSSRFSDWAPPAILTTQIELADAQSVDTSINDSAKCSWKSGNTLEDRRRSKFCSRIEGYGSLCDCHLPAPISFKPAIVSCPKIDILSPDDFHRCVPNLIEPIQINNTNQIPNSQLSQVPIVVMASNRPYYLYRMLRSLLAADGVNRSLVTVFIDGYYDEPLSVSQLFNLRTIQQRPLSQRSARISNHYKSSLTATFELFPSAEFAIIFEEDLDVAQDALIYFNQTLDLLRTDPSLYCVSAWNDQGYEHSVGDNSLIYRIETMPGLGWMLSRRLYKEELEPNWPPADQPHDWDMWIRTNSVRKNRECLIPDISRTFHFGSTGTNINSYFQKQYFSKHALNLITQTKFAQLNQMRADLYEELVKKLVIEALPVDVLFVNSTSHSYRVETANMTAASASAPEQAAAEHLCALANVARLGYSTPSNRTPLSHAIQQLSYESTGNQKEPHYVIYIEMFDKHDFSNWLKLAKCWRIWDLDARGQHNSMWRLFLGKRSMLVVGVPASPYSRYKPKNLLPFRL